MLYKLRNKVAHNRSVKKSEYEKINGLSASIKEVIGKATAKLGEIDINEEDRELIMHSYLSESPAMMGHLAERAVGSYYEKNGYVLSQKLEASRDQGYSFFATKDGKSISVAVKSITTIFADITIGRTLSIMESRANKLPLNERFETHLVCVIRDSDIKYSTEEIIRTIKERRLKSKTNIELYIGLIDEEGNYIKF